MTERPAGPADLSVTLSNARAERVKRVAALAGRSARSRAGVLLVEGPQGVREAVRFAAERVRDVYLSEDAHARHPEIAAEALAAGLYVHLGTAQVLDAMSSDAQGVVAVVDSTGTSLDDVMAAAPRLVAVLSNVRDPGNAGTVIRVADAAGADAVILAGESVDPSNPKVIRSTAGSLFHLPIARAPLADAVAALREAGLTVLAADGSGEDLLGDASAGAGAGGAESLAGPTAWVFGNEAWGLRDEELALMDAVVRIPIHGHAESLNLGTAAAVCLYASATAQRG
ncbi:TrmH family RNA methyltransferase [Demequina mangrovi]|uniref:RNA methyltransferase, TrmH family n=1 Tax=Demequina mangrovi TaxID=1043493 RepID=A0A1H6Z905_9MICO|nr:RNA methyltransferase [Demequina mangrovi]SEJ46152.1 RNA methyltransferase, TrmH family [Demequina mangrovi]